MDKDRFSAGDKYDGGLVEVTDAATRHEVAWLSDAQAEELRAAGVVRAYVPHPIADDNA